MDDFYARFLEGSRKHAPYFALFRSKQDNELMVANVLREEMLNRGEEWFHSVQLREEGEDPPDCEAIARSGARVGIEVTELVDEDSAKAAHTGKRIDESAVDPSTAIEKITNIILRKDRANIKGGIYESYILVIYCDDSRYLDCGVIEEIRNSTFGTTNRIDVVFLLMSYSPWEKRCPYLRLKLSNETKRAE